jgi:hypothetical protein
MFTSYEAARDSSVLMGNGSHASVHGVGMLDLKFTLGKIVQLRNMQHVPTMNKNLVSDSLLCRDGFKVVLESNKVDNLLEKAMSVEAYFSFHFQVFVINP